MPYGNQFVLVDYLSDEGSHFFGEYNEHNFYVGAPNDFERVEVVGVNHLDIQIPNNLGVVPASFKLLDGEEFGIVFPVWAVNRKLVYQISGPNGQLSAYGLSADQVEKQLNVKIPAEKQEGRFIVPLEDINQDWGIPEQNIKIKGFSSITKVLEGQKFCDDLLGRN